MALDTDYFNLWDVLQNEIVGNSFLFFVLALIGLMIFCLYKNIQPEPTITMAVLWTLVFVAATKNMLLYPFTLLFVSVFYYFIVSSKLRLGG